jgi:hypothetical protein
MESLDRRQKTEDRRQRTEDRRQRTENRGRMTEIGDVRKKTKFAEVGYIKIPNTKNQTSNKFE